MWVYVGNVSDIGPKQTFSIALHMSTFDPKRTWWRCAHSNAELASSISRKTTMPLYPETLSAKADRPRVWRCLSMGAAALSLSAARIERHRNTRTAAPSRCHSEAELYWVSVTWGSSSFRGRHRYGGSRWRFPDGHGRCAVPVAAVGSSLPSVGRGKLCG